MTEITREHLRAYLDDSLTDAETARVEQALRDSDGLRGKYVARVAGQDPGGVGDYTAERDALFEGMTLDQIIAEMKARKKEEA